MTMNAVYALGAGLVAFLHHIAWIDYRKSLHR